MKTVYKYPLQLHLESGKAGTALPEGARILHFGEDPNGRLCIWALVDSEAHPTNRLFFKAYDTGQPIDADALEGGHVATVRQDSLVWHIFEVEPPEPAEAEVEAHDETSTVTVKEDADPTQGAGSGDGQPSPSGDPASATDHGVDEDPNP